ncbi:MAG: ATP-binding protein [bacterium]
MRDLRVQFSSALLMTLTAAAVICAYINFQQQPWLLPDDGVVWSERDGAVTALHVMKGAAGSRAGIKAGDVVLRINSVPIDKATDVSRVLVAIKIWGTARYELRRGGVDFGTTLIVQPAPKDFAALHYQYIIGLAYLLIGLYVLFRRGSAPMARHFYVLCLASFVYSTFHFTGKLNNFDRVMYWGNVAGGLLAPTIFLHFCLVFPGVRSWFRRGRIRQAVLYLPAVLLMAVFVGFASGRVLIAVPMVEMNWILDRVWLGFLSVTYLLGGVILAWAYRRAEDPMVRQQIKWLRNGTIAAILPFMAIYVIPYLLGAIPTAWMNAAVLSLLLIPLTWAWAVIRYRLMDVDIIFQQGYVDTLATICVLALFYGLIFSVGKFEDLGAAAGAALVLIAALIFQPIRNWIREVLDRYVFYKDRYDYRRTLIEFARDLSSEVDLDAMLGSAADRLVRTLSIQRVGFFLQDDDGQFRLVKTSGAPMVNEDTSGLDLSFLSSSPDRAYLFFESTKRPLDVISRQWPQSVRHAISELDFTYYIPCSVRGRAIAWLGASRTDKGDFLTSDDLELLITVSGNIGIAVENAQLYRSLERKMEEYERLIESIRVGILAVDLENRVESWNTQMERLTGIQRDQALGRHLSELFPEELVQQLASAGGVHHIYKYKFPLSPAPPKVVELPVHNGGAARGNGGSQQLAQPEVVANIAVAPLLSKEGEQIGRLIIVDDVTERDELERRLMQADKLSSIGLLAAGVAHEVNTPLAVISTYAQMLQRQVSGDDQKARLLDKISKQTFRASEIVNSLLNFSRTSPTAFVEVNLNRVIQESALLIEHQLQKAGIRLELDLEEQIPSIKGNPGKLQQVFLNLFLNARDAMENGGTLTVRSRAQGDAIAVDVLDTGHGISQEHISRIFDPFFTTKAVRKGTGLGLSVTYGIVREHLGVIDVYSQPGEGTRFHLEFPLARKAVHA